MAGVRFLVAARKISFSIEFIEAMGPTKPMQICIGFFP
jgi:hypothetical protein